MRIRATILIIIVSTAGTVLVHSCRRNTDTTRPATPVSFNIPEGFPAPAYNFAGNTLTQEGFELGRKLFYDGRLSKDGQFPCASCHQQVAGFATFEHDLSHGFNNQFTSRNAPGLFNLAWQKEFNWDGGVNHIEQMPIAAITAPNQMAEDLNSVVNKLKADSKYREMFRAAFGDQEINAQRLMKALTQFTGSLVSADSKYDKVKKGEKSFTPGEQAGYTLFQSKCASCHKEPLFTDLSFRNTGLTLNPFLKDAGRMNVTGKKEDSLKFKVPTLRNVVSTFPYAHDGRFWSLDEVLNHYSSEVQDSPTLDPLLKNKLPLSSQEKINLKQFLSTLTDSTFLNNKRFAEPQ